MKKLLLSAWALGLMAIGAYAQTTTFDYTGAMQTYVVPAGVTELAIDCIGASGGTSNYGLPDFVPGDGGRVETTLTVTPGETLNIFVGGEGTDASTGVWGPGGFNGGGDGNNNGSNAGGGGGGASDIRIGGTALADRVVVAGGGGGAGRNYTCCDNGGDGGDLTGANGESNGSTSHASCGGGGTSSAGGVGGQWPGYPLAGAGSLGQGGTGGASSSGGGGGGGYSGGAGGSDPDHGGGGGSFNGGTNQTNTGGIHTGHGLVEITELCDGLTTTVSATSVTACKNSGSLGFLFATVSIKFLILSFIIVGVN